jgi:DNA-binding NarL/FixJ family response regulator
VEPDSQPIRVAVVEDRQEDRDRVVRLLSSAPGFTCVAACCSGEEALETLPHCSPEVILMDIQMAGISGIDCARELKAALPQAEIMMLTVVEDHERIFQSLAAGATGYLLKKTPPLQLLDAIEELHTGGAPMSGQIARLVVADFQQPVRQGVPAAEQLSPVERQVLQFLARGLLYKEVADKMEIAQATVRTHIWHIYRKLHVHNRTEAVLKGLSPKQLH